MFSPLCNRIIRARNFTDSSRTAADVRVVVIHTMESPEGSNTAEAVADWFAGSSAPQASAHYCVDNNSIVGCVNESDVAWAAPGCNRDGVQVELAGRASQTAAQWSDAYSKAELVRAAKLVADICHRQGIPARRLSNADLAAGKSGIIGHVQASQVYKRSTHTDPGSSFPWAAFVKDVQSFMPDTRRWQLHLVDKNDLVVDRSSIVGKAGLSARIVTFSTRVAPRVAKMTLAGKRPRIRVVRVG